jgi:predicted RNA-binding protein YlxR (DUF448 family)
MKVQQRLCVACRKLKPQANLIRLTVNHLTSEVVLNTNVAVFGRSAYICPSLSCLEHALTNKKLRFALEGRKTQKHKKARSIKWPLESQLIKTMSDICAEFEKTCQNTVKEGCFNE